MTFSDMSARLLAAFVFGGIVGLERQIHGRAAGLRTHILVSLGAAVAVISGIQSAVLFPELMIDTGRVVAGIITGVGFLGAGTIVRYSEGIGGLTTAACIWFVAMLGILCGFSFYLVATVASVLALVVLMLLDSLEERLPAASYWMLVVKTSENRVENFKERCRRILEKRGVRLKSSTFQLSEKGTDLYMVVKLKKRKTDFAVAEEIMQLEGVSEVKWLHRMGKA